MKKQKKKRGWPATPFLAKRGARATPLVDLRWTNQPMFFGGDQTTAKRQQKKKKKVLGFGGGQTTLKA
jgi:hypothetical protein